VVSNCHRRNAVTDFLYDSAALVAEDRREDPFRILAR
jgi:hypothetical protein